jgi:cell wall-associated NlpC family hydrolase
MERGGEAVAARARSLVGCRYRFQGRSRAEGFDCVGVAAFALGVEALGKRRAYALRGGDLGTLEAELRDAGLECCRSVAPTIGDLILFAPGVAQLHLAIFAGTGFIHADLGLRKVVERPLPAPWPLLSIWRQAL